MSAVLPLETGPSLEVEARIVEGVALASAVEAHLANLAEAGHIGLFPPAGRARVAMTAAALATEPGDMLFGTARDWVAALARGVTVDDLFLQMFARASASGGGRTLPGAVQDPARGVVLSAGAPAAHLLHAAGFGHAAALRGGDERVAIGLFGSAVAFSQDAHRAFTLAGVAGARVVFVARGADGGVGSLHRAAEGWGLRVVTVDGDDGGAVFRAVQRARDRALAGKGPTLVDARHGDAPAVPHDALVLQRAGRLSSEAERAVDAEIRAAIMTARSAADGAAAPGPETLPEHVRAEAAHEDR
ncbi:MAG: hypothetical protein H6745_28595 [Deltaproteobacteria bacterium]|nr:hypothetical protein [Deltaproteobacteria bacterium]